jgi:hypothetical protein
MAAMMESVGDVWMHKVAAGDKGEGEEMCGSALVTFRGACIYMCLRGL